MDTNELAEYVDQQRWLLNNGLVPDSVKNQLFFYGSVVHKDVQAVEVAIHPEAKTVEYKIYFNKDMLAKIAKYHELSAATSLFGMWRFKRLLQKEGSLDFQSMLRKFVGDFCGPKWTTKVELSSFDVYVDTVGEQSETDKPSQQSDKLPD
jgi:hypothetical protein